MFPVQGPQLAQNGPEVQKRAGLGEEMSREEEGREHSRPQSFPGVVLSSSLSGGPPPIRQYGAGVKSMASKITRNNREQNMFSNTTEMPSATFRVWESLQDKQLSFSTDKHGKQGGAEK